jgi:RNA polymerase sigma-70 factor, ECF subfamily
MFWKKKEERKDVMSDHHEFLTLFLKHQGELLAFIGSVVRDRSVRDDVFQETALVLWEEFGRYDRTRSFGAWARGIAAKKLIQRLDRGERWHHALPVEAIPSILAAFDRTEAPLDVRRDALERCLEKVPAKSRRLLALKYEKGFSLNQIAEQIGSTMDAVNKALSRIRLKLRECVERQLRAVGES